MLKYWNKASVVLAIVSLVYAFVFSLTGQYDKGTFFLVLSFGTMIMTELDKKVN